jgi:hypothetical protein
VTLVAPERPVAPQPALAQRVLATSNGSDDTQASPSLGRPGRPADLLDANSRPTPQESSVGIVPLTAELRRFHVTVSQRFLEKLAAAKDALSHARVAEGWLRSVSLQSESARGAVG